MTKANNCIVCGKEFDEDELQGVVLSKINVTRFKICQTCLDISDPENDYHQAKEIVNSYLKIAEAKSFLKEEAQSLFKEALVIIDSVK